VGAILQSPAAASGLGWLMSGGPVLPDRAGDAGRDRKRDRGEREGTGRARQAAGALLHDGADGKSVGDDQNGRGPGKTGGGKSGGHRR